MEQLELPNKLYFRIGEVGKIVGVKPYVLRYWESEFSVLRPGKTPSHHRLYRRRDVETLLEIKRLLYQEGFTIAGAKKQLKDTDKEETFPESSPTSSAVDYRQVMLSIRDDLRELYRMLDEKVR